MCVCWRWIAEKKWKDLFKTIIQRGDGLWLARGMRWQVGCLVIIIMLI
ncbi:hypothetical protein LINGRAHAP2_LOCUS22565 [Linum grandiflorum]